MNDSKDRDNDTNSGPKEMELYSPSFFLGDDARATRFFLPNKGVGRTHWLTADKIL